MALRGGHESTEIFAVPVSEGVLDQTLLLLLLLGRKLQLGCMADKIRDETSPSSEWTKTTTNNTATETAAAAAAAATTTTTC